MSLDHCVDKNDTKHENAYLSSSACIHSLNNVRVLFGARSGLRECDWSVLIWKGRPDVMCQASPGDQLDSWLSWRRCLAPHKLSNSGGSASGASELLHGFPGAAQRLRWSLRFRESLIWVTSSAPRIRHLFILVYWTKIEHGKPTVALWIKTYSLYLAALQPLSVSEPQATCVNVRPPKTSAFVAGFELRSPGAGHHWAELKMEVCVCVCLVRVCGWTVCSEATVALVPSGSFFPLRVVDCSPSERLMWCQAARWQRLCGLSVRTEALVQSAGNIRWWWCWCVRATRWFDTWIYTRGCVSVHPVLHGCSKNSHGIGRRLR